MKNENLLTSIRETNKRMTLIGISGSNVTTKLVGDLRKYGTDYSPYALANALSFGMHAKKHKVSYCRERDKFVRARVRRWRVA
jgi:hypothetical protein